MYPPGQDGFATAATGDRIEHKLMPGDAVTLVVRKPHLTSQRTIQRYVRVGFVKAQRLLLLMDDYGITNGQPHSRWESRMVLVKPASLPVTLARLREVAAREGVPVEGSEDA